MAAMLIAKTLQVPDEVIISGLQSYRNVPHRMEAAGEMKGVRFINDSKATNVDAVFYALEDIPCEAKKPCIIWIAGGIDKGNNYEQLIPLVSQKVKALVCLGTDNTRLINNFRATVPKMTEAVTMQKAVEKALDMAVPGDVILLSPACSSFDLFKNYEDRGDQFKAVVQQFMQQQQT
jgi:UDP-N-acetylmuramoylalanine--D-glutamate ligase